LEPWPPEIKTKPPHNSIWVSTLNDVDYLALAKTVGPETRRRLAAADYVARERAKRPGRRLVGRDREQVISEAEKRYGPFSVSLADWLRRSKRRAGTGAGTAHPKLRPPPEDGTR
jgi:hypothetical protein